MDTRFRDKILDRIAELAQGNEARLLDYLDDKAMSTGAERQARLTERRKAEGKRRVPAWLAAHEEAELKRLYPGPRGGIDWSAVIRAALDNSSSDAEY